MTSLKRNARPIKDQSSVILREACCRRMTAFLMPDS
jgi:hypothetical protein